MKKYFTGLSRNTFLLALGSLFSDISTEMLYPVLPVYLTQVLKSSGSVVGVIEGVATATQNIVQGFSGLLSDKLQRRKRIALVGYVMSAIAKPAIGLVGNWEWVLGARFLDRLGTGTRSAPRDALIAGSAGEKYRGKAFGLEGIGDNLGAFLGPLLTVFLLFSLGIDMKFIFYLAIIPGLLAVIMITLVKERQTVGLVKEKFEITFKKFPSVYWKYLLVTAIFGMGNLSSAFLILRTKDIGISLETTILIYAVFNLVAAISSYPAGFLSDNLGRKKILLVAFALFLLTNIGFGVSRNVFVIAFLFGIYGVFQGILRTVGKAFASDFVEQKLRASSIGWYSTTVGLSGLLASITAGQLWDRQGHTSVFIYGAALALAGLLALLILIPSRLNKNEV